MKLGFILIWMLAGAASGAIEKRIVGSKSCNKDRQYHVQIQSTQGGKSCGGSLLNTRWVITASHCAEQHATVKMGSNADVSFLKRWSVLKKSQQQIELNQQFTFKDEEGHSHDIMLIKLNQAVSAELPTIELPPADCQRPEDKQQVEVGGWGATKADVKKPKIPKKLQCAMTDIIACGENDKPDSKYHSDESTTMCAFKPGVEACSGDAGSAVEYNDLLYGIIVSKPVDKCATTIVMLNICHYRKWIDETMQNNP